MANILLCVCLSQIVRYNGLNPRFSNISLFLFCFRVVKCPLRFSRTNDVRFVFYSCLIYIGAHDLIVWFVFIYAYFPLKRFLCSCRLAVSQRVPIRKQKLPVYPSGSRGSLGIRVSQLLFYVVLCGLSFLLGLCFICPLIYASDYFFGIVKALLQFTKNWQ